MEWISLTDRLPENNQRVLAFLPNNLIYLPGKTGDVRFTPVIFLRFALDFFKESNPKREKFGPHFWVGEGQSNHYFNDVTHWMPAPAGPNGEKEELRRAE
jgi:hypothetical protein